MIDNRGSSHELFRRGEVSEDLKPAAWAIEYPNGFLSLYGHEADARTFAPRTCKIRPLYLAPPPDAGVVEGLAEALRRIKNIEHGWNRPHRLDTARGMVDDCVSIARFALAAYDAAKGGEDG